jgi:hypothetical protein
MLIESPLHNLIVNFSYLSHLTIDSRDASQKYISSKVLIEVPRNTPATAIRGD